MPIPESLRPLFPSELSDRLLSLRRELHRHPELSFEEHRTAERLQAELESLGAEDVRRVAGTGVIGIIRGSDPDAPMVAIRGDIDALPIQEETGLDYPSEVGGVMHACGHDVHATWAIGAAHLLARRPAGGDVLILLQPAEETGHGAEAVLADDPLDRVAMIFGGHVDRRFAVGEVVAQAGALAASADDFQLRVVGRGAHAARPHEADDPIVGAAAIIMALQTVISRRLNPATPGVVTVGSINGGSANNIIPNAVTLSGTIRALDPETRSLLHEEVRHVVETTAAAHRLTAEFDLRLGPPPIVNPEAPAALAREAAASLLGHEAIIPLPSLNLGGEDFATYMERVPGCFLRIGAREAGGEVIPAHNPAFYAADGCIFVGAAVLAEAARRASEQLSG